MTIASEKVSVVIPTYNRAELLMAAVKSLQEQTYRNIEIVIVDDCSTDSTARIVESIDDKRIVYLQHKVNKGGAEARNTGIKHATGSVIGFLDSDDQWLPDKLEKQLAVFKKNPKAEVVYTGIKVMQNTTFIKDIFPKYKEDLLIKLLESNCIYTTSSILVKKEILEQIEGFDSSLPSCQDWDLYIRLAKISQFEFVKEPLVLYFQHPGERISTNHKAVVDGHMRIYEIYKGLAHNNGESVFRKFSFKIAKTIFRVGLISQDKEKVKLSRKILVASLSKKHTMHKSMFLYLSTYVNLKFLLYLHTRYERFNTGYYSFAFKKTASLSGQKTNSVTNKGGV
ncbi:glycosyltransferase family 2 protein [Planococcus glaciei]|uniref:glycosyltransferase family 2 protein n=1 Tax=Planococcus glaciei TaxID=459472 RepID=UPI000943DC6A|nr:glycosyltransferase family 2 protein [Planococcus glaciei]